jgi:mRNA-decapping enzyme 1B
MFPFSSAVEIFGLWFYDQEECARLAELIETLKVEDREKMERRRALSAAKKAARAADGQENDIMRILVDANNEFISKVSRLPANN